MRLRTKAALAVAALVVVAHPALASQVTSRAHHAFDALSTRVHTLSTRVHTLNVTGSATPAPHAVAQPAKVEPSTAEAGEYVFTATNPDGTPARWNPCAAHDIVVNPSGAPAGALRDLRVAVRTLDKASGLRFVISDTTSARPTAQYGTREVNGVWPPVLIAWGPPGTGPLGTSGEAGETQPVWLANSAGKNVFVSAEIVFDSNESGYAAGFRPGTLSRGALMLHELGHMAGLAHTVSNREIMYPEIGATTQYGPGDLAGLKALGSGGCLATPTI